MKRLIVALIVTFSIQNIYSQQKEEADKLVREGVVLHDKGEYSKAISKYDEALKIDSDNFLALAEMSITLNATHKYDEAAEYCKKAIEKHPHNDFLDNVYVTYGNSLDALGKSSEALEIYDDGLKVFPQYYHLYFNKGVTLVALKEYEDALENFDRAVACNPKHASSHNAVGRLLYSDKKRIPAILAISRFMVIEPQGQRAKDNLELMEKMLGANVEQTGKNSISINLNAATLGDTLPNGKPNKNSFRTAEIILSMTSALDFDKKNSGKTRREQFLRKFETLCSTLQESQKDNHGFYWEYYVPYFIEMQEKGYLETFSYLVYASSDDKKTAKWLKGNEKTIESFYAWSSKFAWPEV